MSVSPLKVIVQGIPSELFNIPLFLHTFSDSLDNSLEVASKICLKAKLECLIQLFSTFGPVRCTYVFPRMVQIPDDFAHVTFDNSADALKAWNAGQQHQIAIEGHVLTLTLVSDDEEIVQTLNDDCLIKIFSLLDPNSRVSAEYVCKRWEKLAGHSWSHQKSIWFDASCDLEALEAYALRCGQYLEAVDFAVTYEGSQSSLSIIAQHCPNVTSASIDLNCDDVDDEKFSSALSSMKHLRELRLEGICDDFSFDFLDSLPADMEKIWFSAEHSRSDPFLNVLLSIDLSRFRHLTGFALNYFVICAGGLRGLESLENLNFANLEGSYVYHSVAKSFEQLTKLRYLLVPDCQIEDNVLLNIVANNKGLETLDVSFARSLTDRSLMAVSRCVDIKRLRMRNLPNVELNFMDPMPKLMELNCKDCSKVKEEQLMKIIQTSPKLQRLNVVGCSVTRNFFHVVNSVMKSRNNSIVLKITTTVSYDTEENGKSPLLKIEAPDYSEDSSEGSDSD